jgi:protein arginine kinase activator
MVCQACQKNLAKVHCTEIDPVKKEKTESHLCEACAQQQGMGTKQGVSLPDLIHQIVGPNIPEELRELFEKPCPECGITYPEFRSRGRLGCPHDYDVFRKGLEPLLDRIHGGTTHKGKRPVRGAPARDRRKELSELQKEMRSLVAGERYEDAARVRDRIRELEREAP